MRILHTLSAVTLLLLIGCAHAHDKSVQTTPMNPHTERTLAQLTGLKPPPPQELRRRIMSQDVKASAIRQIAQRLGSRSVSPAALAVNVPPTAIPEAFDWSAQGKVSPVRDQDSCGSCWDFASCAAFEANFIIRNSGARPVDVDAAEQCVLDCVPTYDCGGGWWDEPFNLMLTRGLPNEFDYPYTAVADKSNCRLNDSNPPTVRYRAVNWGYVDRDDTTFMPTDQAMKRAILDHGPIAVAFNATADFVQWGWNGAPGVFKTQVQGDINHGIVIVGWDNNKDGGAWKIKNSWGCAWGQSGFAWVGFGVNKIGFNAAWVEAASPNESIFKDATFLSTIGSPR